jgi:hypothetical protein
MPEELVNRSMEGSLVKLVTKTLNVNVKLGRYQKVEMYIHNETIMETILKDLKFKSIGNIYDYPDDLPIPETMDGTDMSTNFKMFQRIAVSKKFNAVVLYTSTYYAIYCMFLVNSKHLKKFSKILSSIREEDSQKDIFRGVNFKCKDGVYLEIVGNSDHNSKSPVDVIRNKIVKENLVFSSDSTIAKVMHDICSFFTEETRKMYESMQIAHKRGIILYGNPGNGKSAMIRQIIRNVPDITKIVMNPNVEAPTKILGTLIKSLAGRPTIIIIEDIDSLITHRNRSEFLNILDGVDMKSGIFFIGTTNYPEQIDPAFMNRSGRFDRTYEIGDPADDVRRLYFSSRKIDELLSGYKVYRDNDKEVTPTSILDLYVKYSDKLPMATLKEIMTGTQYMLVMNKDMSIEEALETTYNTITRTKNDHSDKHEKHKKSKRTMPFMDAEQMEEPGYLLPTVVSEPVKAVVNGSYIRNERGLILIHSKPKEVSVAK